MSGTRNNSDMRQHGYAHPYGKDSGMSGDECGEKAVKLVLFFIVNGAVLVDLVVRLAA